MRRHPEGTGTKERRKTTKRIITGILLLAMLTMLAGCVSKKTYESVQQELSDSQATIVVQQTRIDELSSELDRASEALNMERRRSAELATSLEQTGAELEETQAVIQNTKAQLADAQEQLGAISETPFGLYYIMDTPSGLQLQDVSGEILIDGYVLIRNDDDVKPRHGVKDVTLGHWVLVGASAPGVEVDRDILSGLITGLGVSPKYMAVGYQEVLDHFSRYSADHYGSKLMAYIACTWKPGLGWVSDDPVRVLKNPLVEYHVNDFFGHAVSPRFEILEKTKQVMTLALDPELIVQASESAAEAGVDFEEWLTEAILAKIR